MSSPQTSAPHFAPRQRFSSAPGTAHQYSTDGHNDRSSMASDTAPSFTLSSGCGSSSSNGTPNTPPQSSGFSNVQTYRTSKAYEQDRRNSSFNTDSASFRISSYANQSLDHTLPAIPNGSAFASRSTLATNDDAHYAESKDRFDDYPLSRGGVANHFRSKPLIARRDSDRTATSGATESGRSSIYTNAGDGGGNEGIYLYTAAAMATSDNRANISRGGYRILSMK